MTFQVRSGGVVGIASVGGNRQFELCEGRSSGSPHLLRPHRARRATSRRRRRKTEEPLGYIPFDRHRRTITSSPLWNTLRKARTSHAGEFRLMESRAAGRTAWT